jgi:TLC domain
MDPSLHYHNGVFYHSNVDGSLQYNATVLNECPPAPILWATGMLDLTLCSIPLGVYHTVTFSQSHSTTNCPQYWRQTLLQPVVPARHYDRWIAQELPSITTALPPMQSFASFAEAHQGHLGQLLYQYAFTTSNTELADLGSRTAAVTLLVLVLLLRVIKHHVLLPTFSSVGRRLGRQSHGPDWEQANEIRIVKFGEYVFRLLYHSAISLYGYSVFGTAPYWHSTQDIFRHFPHHEMVPSMTWYYLLQSAYNIDAFVSLLVLSFQFQWFPSKQKTETIRVDTKANGQETRRPNGAIRDWILIDAAPLFQFGWNYDTIRGDFTEMCIHHFITNFLVVGSSVCRLTRVGSMVFLVHDISDVPVDCSKLANFLKWKTCTIVCFFFMCIVWLYTRLYLLPWIIYRAILYQSHFLLESGALPPLIYCAYRPLFVLGIGLLILLHTSWFCMFIRMGMLIVKKNETHDLSEHKKGEDQGLSTPDTSQDKKTN